MEILEKILEIIISIITSISMLISGNMSPKQKLVMDIPAMGTTHTVQGGCSDGKYIYIVLHNPDEASPSEEDSASNSTSVPRESKIIKIDPATWTIVLTSEDLFIDHANDMTYLPDTNEIYISNNEPNYKRITILDADTLTIKATKDINDNIYTIEYIIEENCYYCGLSGTYDFSKYDGDFNVINTYIGINNGYTRQGMTSDEENLYFLYYNMNCIYKYSKDGTFMGKLELPVTENEPENIFWFNGDLYVTYNILGKLNGGSIYMIKHANFK